MTDELTKRMQVEKFGRNKEKTPGLTVPEEYGKGGN